MDQYDKAQESLNTASVMLNLWGLSMFLCIIICAYNIGV